MRELKALKKIKLKIAKKRAWDAFSKYIRTKYKNKDGTLTCYTCGRNYPFKKMSSGHGIGGRNNSVLFDERIVKPQCAGCNIWGRGKYAIFTRKLIDELGLEGYDDVVSNSQKTVQYKVYQYLEIEEKYIAKIKDLDK